MGSQKFGPSIPSRIWKFLLAILMISEKIISNEGQPMSHHSMNIYPLEGILPRMMSHGTQGFPYLVDPISPLAYSPHLPIHCESEQNFIEPHTFDQWKRGKWKMVKPRIIPWQPCVVGKCPQEVGSSHFQKSGVEKFMCIKDEVKNIQNETLPDPSTLTLPISTGNGTTPQLNVTVSHKTSLTNTGEKMASNKSQKVDENHDKVSVVTDDGNGWLSSLCRSPMILYERYGQPNVSNCVVKFDNLTNPGVANITNSTRMQIECVSPALVALNCLACMLAKNAENITINGTSLKKKLDDSLDPVEYLEVGASIFKHSNGSQTQTKLTKEQMIALENCWADGNKSEPYLINGHPLIVKLHYLNQTEKYFILTKKTGHDLVVAVPHEFSRQKDRTTTVGNNVELNQTTTVDNNVELNQTTTVDNNVELNQTTTVDNNVELNQTTTVDNNVELNQTTTVDNNVELNQTTTVDNNVELNQSVPDNKVNDDLSNWDLPSTYLSDYKGPMGGLEKLLIETEINHTKDKITRHTSTTPKTAKPQESINEESSTRVEEQDDYFDNSYDHQSYNGDSNVGILTSTSECTNSSDAKETTTFDSLLPENLPSQSALSVSEIRMMAAMRTMNRENDHQRTYFQTLRHGGRPNYECRVLNSASNIETTPSSNDLSNEPRCQGERKLGAKYEKCRSKGVLEPENKAQCAQPTRQAFTVEPPYGNNANEMSWQLDEQTAEHDIDTDWTYEDPNRPQHGESGGVNWPGNYLGIQNLGPFQPRIVPSESRMY